MSHRLAVIIIFTLILADLGTGLLFNLGWSFNRIGLPLKILIMLGSLLFYALKTKEKTFQSLYLAMITLFFLWLMGSFVSYLINSNFSYVYSLIVLNRYFFFLVLSCIFIDVDNAKSFDGKCNKILDSFFLINNTFILFGALFTIHLFSTFNPQGEYNDVDHRFGYKGLIFGGNEVAGIYLLGLAHYFRKNFVYNENSPWLLATTCLAGMLTGTKAIFLGTILLSLYFFLKYRLKVFVVLVNPLIIITISFVIIKWNYVKENYLSYTLQLYNNQDFISFFLSGRNKYLDKHLQYIKSKWTTINFIVGDAFLYIEMDFLDLYFFFGIGALIYLYLYIKIYFIKDKSKDNLYVFCVLMSVSILAGHIIQSAVVPLFLLLYIFAAKTENRLT